MKKPLILAAILAAVSSLSIAYAAEKPETSCPTTGMMASQANGEILSCGKDLKWHRAGDKQQQADTNGIKAGEKAETPCPTTGMMASQANGELMSCGKDLKWHLPGVQQKADANVIKLSVQLMEGEKMVTSSMVTTLEGAAAPFSVADEVTYIAEAKKEGDRVTLVPGVVRSGFFMDMTPTIATDGHIAVAFNATKSELMALSNLDQGDGMSIQLPQVSSVYLKQTVSLEAGKEMSIPFGPLMNENAGGGLTVPAQPKYMLKLVATKI